ncbi:MAG: class I SAM-dependent methyltransferase [Alphaproteobacteria bacterium]|nr:class I SAM-dependent methyltransferase [Alphaproteobacteria bacterium]
MKFQEIYSIVGSVPFITKKNGRFLYDLILREKITNIIELGFAHGTATCYMAAALHELGEGSITSVDLIEARDSFRPSAEEQLEKTGLSKFVDLVRTQTGYTWFLHDDIVRNTKNHICNEVYDLCIIDGPKNWTIDGAAFFLIDKLLKKNSWIIFDDYDWTYTSADKLRNSTDGITHRSLSKDEQEIPHIREIFELLVKQHPHYGEFLLFPVDNWAIAQKTVSGDKTYIIDYRDTTKDLIVKIFYRVYRMLKGR